jgi:hypothetical protein
MPELHPGSIPDLDNERPRNGLKEGPVSSVPAQVPDSGPPRATEKKPSSKVRLVVTPQERVRMVFSGLFSP